MDLCAITGCSGVYPDAPHLGTAAFAFLGAGLALVFGTGVLLRAAFAGAIANTNSNHVAAPKTALLAPAIFWLLCLCVSGYLFVQSLAFAGLLTNYPWLMGSESPLIFLIGPLLYWFYLERTQANSAAAPAGKHWLALAVHLLPALLATVYRLFIIAGPTPDARELWLLAMTGELALVAYTGVILWQLRDALLQAASGNDGPDAARGRQIQQTTALLCLDAAIVGVLALFALLGWPGFRAASTLGLTATICLLYFADRAFPRYFEDLFAIGRAARYRKSRLGDQDLPELDRRLRELMLSQQPYLEDDLTLAGLAERLDISGHQLSEFLNDRLGQSFHNYVNEHRIRAACEYLENSTDTVLAIAYAVGFNNRASFNTAFQKFSGTTPIAYRRARLKSKARPA